MEQEENIGIELVRTVAKRIMKEFLSLNVNELFKNTRYIEWQFSHYLAFNVFVTVNVKDESGYPLEIMFKCDGEDCKFMMQIN